jgi:hypothetical protein
MDGDLPCLVKLSGDDLREVSSSTLRHYQESARSVLGGNARSQCESEHRSVDPAPARTAREHDEAIRAATSAGTASPPRRAEHRPVRPHAARVT